MVKSASPGLFWTRWMEKSWTQKWMVHRLSARQSGSLVSLRSFCCKEAQISTVSTAPAAPRSATPVRKAYWVVEILVWNNADPEILDAWGNSSLMYAVVAGHSPVEFLVRAFKRLRIQIDNVGNSPLEVAKLLGRTKCVTALTNTSRKEREAGGGAQGKKQQYLSWGCGDKSDTLERVGLLVNKLHLHHKDCNVGQNRTWYQRPRVKLCQIPRMGSIGELDGELCDSSSPPQELDLAEVQTPKPPPRTTDHSPSFKNPEPGERLTHLYEHLLPLTQSHGAKQTMFFSPQPTGHSPKLSASSALDILLTPILISKMEKEARTEKSRKSDFGARRFYDSYYQKRCSLPSSVLRPKSPVRDPVRMRKSRTALRRKVSPCKAEPAQFAEPVAATPSTTFSVLRNKFLRRFTSFEFKGDVKELTSGRMPLWETFPEDTNHPQVGSKPSIDGISSVTCEFDVHLRMQNA